MKASGFISMYTDHNPDDSLIFRVSQLGPNYRLSRNFRLHEAQCSDGTDIVYVHPALLCLMQKVRDEYGPLQVNSLFRSRAFNTSIRGSKKSKHLLGMAVDVMPLEMKLERFTEEISKWDNIGGIGIYRTFIHLDVYGNNRRWNG